MKTISRLLLLSILMVAALLLTAFGCSSTDKGSSGEPGFDWETGGGGFSFTDAAVLYSGNKVSVVGEGSALTMSGPFGKIVYDTETGLADVYEGSADTPGAGVPYLAGVFAETEIAGRKVRTYALTRDAGAVSAIALDDAFGKGVKVSVVNRGKEGPGGVLSIKQNYYLYEDHNYALFEAVVSGVETETNYVSPLAAGNAMAGATGAAAGSQVVFLEADAKDPRFLFVPFDNDAFVRYRSDRLMGASESYEVTAVFDNTSRRGFVTGSVTHDIWKTGIRAKTGGRNGAVTELRVFGGITSSQTRDTLPHGTLVGAEIASPKVFLGYFADWRDGMEEYGRANGIVSPPLAWDAGPPFGWNSWSAVAEKVDYDIFVTASDFLKDNLPTWTNHQGVVYINFDSFWDNLTEVQRRNAAAHVKKNGQRAGIYHTPFVFWGNVEQSREWSPGETDGRYKWFDLLLKDEKGRPVPAIDGGMVLDPTHPGTIQVTKRRLDQFREWGFTYVKLDFMSHGAVEGRHYEKSVRTGIQAYNYGMQKLLDGLGDDIKNQNFFISLSIAPIFPAQYAHGRRICCDVFGDIANAEYMLNSLNYGWWLNRTVYPYNDPDHIVVYNSFNHKEPYLYNEGLTRYVSTAIGGTFMIDSDDIRLPEAQARVKQILGNKAINNLAADGVSFRPVEGNTNDRAGDAFIRKDGNNLYLAVFNYNKEKSKTVKLDAERLGLDGKKSYRMVNLITNKEETVSGTITVELEAAEPKIFRLY
ncbi:alpha-galactosidase [Spirochaetia bacterium]|nr:alpha-galactosidase [Spirochaetia bacterium]